MKGFCDDSVFVKNPCFVERKFKDEILLLPVDGEVATLEEFYHLNETAAKFWNLVDGCKNFRQIFDYLKRDYAIPPEKLEKDIRKLTKKLIKIGVILCK